MEKKRIAINGFWSNWSNIFSSSLENDNLEIVAVNDLADMIRWPIF
jgi:glyceraldehyde-3-phosphate dehydrogenase/erythrose-4-phosphate dehydrogenase